MQLAFDIIILGFLFFYIILSVNFSDSINDINEDVHNLYSSRDSLWNEFFKLQQTAKRRDKEYRRRIHNLECKLKKLEHRDVKS